MKITIDTEQDSVHLNHIIEFLTALVNKAPKSVVNSFEPESPELNAEPSLFNLFNEPENKKETQEIKETEDKDDFNLQYY